MSEGTPQHRRRRSLTREAIVDASIQRLRRFGREKFSIRAVAKDLGVTPMAIYRHVPSKEALVEALRESLLSLVPLVVETDRDDDRVEQPLSEKDIVEAALRLVREQGLDKLNMRTLAHQLGVTPMALYRHVPGKASLLARMTDMLIERLPQPPASLATWEDDFRTHALHVWREFSKYPGLVGSFTSGPSPKVLDHMGYERSILLASGTSERVATLAATAYHTFLLGLFRSQAYLDFLSRRLGPESGVSVESIRRYDDRVALTELLDFALEAIVAGVRARETAVAKASAGKPKRGVRRAPKR
jgi:AcrR family transcriptional regulator